MVFCDKKEVGQMSEFLWLKIIRTEKGLTQKQVAEMIGTTRENYNAYENGRVKPMDITKYKIAKALDFDIKKWGE